MISGKAFITSKNSFLFLVILSVFIFNLQPSISQSVQAKSPGPTSTPSAPASQSTVLSDDIKPPTHLPTSNSPAHSLQPSLNSGSGSTVYTAVSVGGEQACGLTGTGGIKCWGGNSAGQLGNGNNSDSYSPVDVVGLTSGVTAISAGYTHTCALTTGGAVKCWGSNLNGALGNSSNNDSNVPVSVTGLASGVIAIESGNSHTCALITGGGVKCWGSNASGQLGNTSNSDSNFPVDVSGLTGATAISAGGAHTCAITSGGGIVCWGANGSGQLGDASFNDRNYPLGVSGLSSGIANIGAGYNHSCAQTTGGAVMCWGDNGVGQLGNGSNDISNIPVNVSGLSSGVKNISAGTLTACAITSSNGLKCWGSNASGKLGNGGTTNSSVPVDVVGLSSGVSGVSAGSWSTCAYTTISGLKCWGYNGSGGLGDGTIIDSDFPVTVIDSTSTPTVNRILRADPNPNSSDSIDFTVTFSESVTGVDTSDFFITKSGVIGSGITNVSGSGAVYNVNVSTGFGDGSLRLDLVDDDTIQDSAGNMLGGTGTGNGNYSTGDSYTMTRPASVNVLAAGALQGNYSILDLGYTRRTYNALNNGPMQTTSSNGKSILSSIQVKYSNVSYSEMLGLPTTLLSKEYWFPVYNSTGSLATQLRVGNMGGTSTVVTVYIGNGTQLDQFTLAANQALRKTYSGTNNGPLRVVSSSTNVMTSVRYLYATYSYSEELGMPVGQLTNDYWFPWYNNVAFPSELRVANVGSSPANVSVYIGNGTLLDSFTLGVGQNNRTTYASANNGPLRVVSTGANILPSIKVLYNATSYSEMLGMPASRLTNDYWMPFYDSQNLASQVRVGNMGGTSTTISVYQGNNILLDSYTLGVGAATRKTYTGTIAGPLHIVSSATNIMVSTRELFTTNNFVSYYELLAYPGNKLTTEYWFPWYNNSAFLSELRIGVP